MKVSEETFDTLDINLLRLSEKLEDAISSAERAINEIHGRFERCILQKQNIVSACSADLQSCEEDPNADCSHQQETLRAAFHSYEIALDEFRIFRDAKNAFADKQPLAHMILERDIPAARQKIQFFTQLLDELIPLRASLTEHRKNTNPSPMTQAPGSARSTSPPTGTLLNTASRENPSTNSEWVTRRGMMALIDLPEPEGISGASDFTKVSMEEMKDGLAKLQDILQLMKTQTGIDSVALARYDELHGLDYRNGYQRVYDAFFGHEPIRVERGDHGITIINGRHRIWLAKRMGINALPVVLTEKRGLS